MRLVAINVLEILAYYSAVYSQLPHVPYFDSGLAPGVPVDSAWKILWIIFIC